MCVCVCVLGIDSRYNEGCTELAKYLFYGLYGRNQMNLDNVLEDYPEEMLDGECCSPDIKSYFCICFSLYLLTLLF